MQQIYVREQADITHTSLDILAPWHAGLGLDVAIFERDVHSELLWWCAVILPEFKTLTGLDTHTKLQTRGVCIKGFPGSTVTGTNGQGSRNQLCINLTQ